MKAAGSSGGPDATEGQDAAPRGAIDTIFRRMLRNAGTMLGGKLVMGLVNLAATGIALRALGIEQLGLLVLIHAFAQTAAAFVKFQSWQAVLRYGTASLEHGRRAEFRALLRFTAGLDAASAVVGTLVCSAAAWWLGGIFDIPREFAGAAALYATSTAFMVMATPTGLLRLFNRFDVLATRDTMGALVRLAGAGAVTLLGGGLTGFLAVWYVATAVGGLALAFAAWRETKQRGLLAQPGEARPPRASSVHPGLWSFVWTTNLTTTFSLASGNLGTLCAGAMLGPAEAALFSVARQLGEAALRPGRFLSPAIYPELARLAAMRDQAGIRALLRRVLLVSSGGAAALLVALALLGHPLLRLLGGAAALPAYPVMLLLGIAAAIGFAGFALEPLLMSVDRQGAALRARVAATLLYVPAALTGMHLAGLWGAGLAAIATALLMLAVQALSAVQALKQGIRTIPGEDPGLAPLRMTNASPGASPP